MPGEREPIPQDTGYKPLPNEVISSFEKGRHQEGNIVGHSLRKTLAAIANKLQQPSILRPELATGQLGVSAVSAPTRPAESPTRRAEPEIQVPPTPSKPRKHLSKKAIAARLTGLLFLLSNGGLGVKHHIEYDEPLNPQAIARDILSIPGQWWNLGQNIKDDVLNRVGVQTVPEIFDNSLDSIIVEAGRNATPIASGNLITTANNIKFTIENNMPQATVLFPVKLKEKDHVELSTTYGPVINEAAKRWERGELNKNLIISRSGTEIIVPVGKAELYQIAPLMIDNNPYFAGVVLRFTGNDGLLYELIIRAPDDVRQLKPLTDIADAPTLGENGIYVGIGKNLDQKGIPVTAGTSIAKTATSNANINFDLKVLNPENSDFHHASINFVTSGDKVLYLKDQAS